MTDQNDCLAVVGLGYVGLPLATVFANAGVRVIGLDVAQGKVDRIMSGRSVTPDVEDADVARLVQAGMLEATTDFSKVAEAGLVSICVPTPLRKSRDPDISYIVSACESLVPHVQKGTAVVLESTTYPGTTREIILPRFEEAGFRLGEDLYLSFSPERIDPGNAKWNIKNTPKVVGGLTAACGEKARAFYARALDDVIVVRDAETAEMCKLLENTFRSVNIGLVNELAMVCNRLGISAFEVIEAAATKPFGFMPFRPGPGLGGHCLPIDPLYLSWKMRMLDYKVRFIDLADEVNSSMPAYVVQRAQDILNDEAKALKGSKVLVLGLAYKRDVDDVRESPALDLFDEFAKKGASVVYHDPWVPSYRHAGAEIQGLDVDAAMSVDIDLIVVATDHSNVDYAAFAARGVPVLDTRNALGSDTPSNVHQL